MAKNTLRLLKPAYYDKFRCVGACTCGDHCCKEWQITIDKATYMKYRAIRDAEFQRTLPERLKRKKGQGASNLQYAELLLDDETKNCKFLCEGGMCEIQRKFGASYLSKTCRDYPRKAGTMLGDVVELALVMSCPEAVRLGLLDEQPVSFIYDEIEVEDHDPLLSVSMTRLSKTARYSDIAFDIRNACIDILQTRTMPLADRIFALGMMLQAIEELGDDTSDEAAMEVVSSYRTAAASGQFPDVMARFAESDAMAGLMQKALIDSMGNIIGADTHGANAVKRLLGNALKWGESEGEEIEYGRIYTRLKTLTKQYFIPFMETRGYVLENYFVNLVFAQRFPFFSSDVSPYAHFVSLANQYAIFRLLLSSGAEERGEIDDELLVSVLSILYGAAHHSTVSSTIAKVYLSSGFGTLAHIPFLIRD